MRATDKEKQSNENAIISISVEHPSSKGQRLVHDIHRLDFYAIDHIVRPTGSHSKS
jgi:hypothetical protein